MKITAFLMLALQAVQADNHFERTNAVLTNDTRFRRIVSRISSIRARRVLTQVYMQCAAGFRDINTDPACHKVAIIMMQ